MSRTDVAKQQNEKRALRFLAANSHFYGLGKRILALQMFLTVGLALLLPAITCFFPEFKVAAAFIGITVAWLDVAVIDRIQIYYRKQGANGQEQFDCDLFEIQWNELRCGKRINEEEIYIAANAFLRKNTDEKLKDWYAPELGRLPLTIAPLACQKLSLWWDLSQRRVYGHILACIWVLGVIGVVAWSVSCAQSIKDTILVTYASIAPGIMWCARESRRHLDAANTLEKARTFVDRAWNNATGGMLAGDELKFTIRQIQDAMFENRSKNPMIFNWIYALLRPARETAMRETATDLVEKVSQ